MEVRFSTAVTGGFFSPHNDVFGVRYRGFAAHRGLAKGKIKPYVTQGNEIRDLKKNRRRPGISVIRVQLTNWKKLTKGLFDLPWSQRFFLSREKAAKRRRCSVTKRREEKHLWLPWGLVDIFTNMHIYMISSFDW